MSEFAAMKDIRKEFGIRIKILRHSKGISQEKLGELADLDRTYIPGIENGQRNVSLLVIQKLANAFGISISELLEEL